MKYSFITEEQALDVVDVLNLNCAENTYIERMQVELKMLTNKKEKLEKFITTSDKFNQLRPVERTLLFDQFSAMKAYARVLNDRIDYAIAKAQEQK